MAYASVPLCIKEIPGHVKTHKMCNEEVHIEPGPLAFVPDRLKTRNVQRGSAFRIIHTRLCP